MRSTLIRATLLAAVAATSLSGCGGDKSEAEPGFTAKSYSEIKGAVIEDMKAATSVHIVGSLTSDGQDFNLDLKLGQDSVCDGTIDIEGGTAGIRGVDGDYYLKGDADFWNALGGPQGAMIVSLVGDKWAKLPSGAGASFAGICDIEKFVDEMSKDEASSTDEKVGEVSEVAGTEVIELTSTEDGGTVHVSVTTADPHYILSMKKEGGKNAGDVTFSDYGAALTVEAPASDEVVDLGQVGG